MSIILYRPALCIFPATPYCNISLVHSHHSNSSSSSSSQLIIPDEAAVAANVTAPPGGHQRKCHFKPGFFLFFFSPKRLFVDTFGVTPAHLWNTLLFLPTLISLHSVKTANSENMRQEMKPWGTSSKTLWFFLCIWLQELFPTGAGGCGSGRTRLQSESALRAFARLA